MHVGVEVQHEIGERAFKPGSEIIIDGESRPADLGRPVEIKNAEGKTQFPMRLGLKIKLARLSPASDFPVLSGRCAHRHGFMRQVRNPHQNFTQLLVTDLRFLIELVNLQTERLHLSNLCRGILLLLFECGDFVRDFIAASLATLRFHQPSASFAVDRLKISQEVWYAALAQLAPDEIEVFTDKSKVQHARTLSPYRRC